MVVALPHASSSRLSPVLLLAVTAILMRVPPPCQAFLLDGRVGHQVPFRRKVVAKPRPLMTLQPWQQQDVVSSSSSSPLSEPAIYSPRRTDAASRGSSSRSDFLKGLSLVLPAALVAGSVAVVGRPEAALADTPTKLEPLVLPALEEYSDPEGVFKVRVPQGWFTKRKGDKDREGIVFITGDFKQAVTVSVEVLHIKELFKFSGIDTGGLDAPLDDWSKLGSASGMANMLSSHKEALIGKVGRTASDRSGIFVMIPESIGAKGTELKFDFLTDIRVQRPDLLMEELGVRELKRRTRGRALLLGNQGEEGDRVVVAWGGAMSRDWDRGYGELLDQILDSVTVEQLPPRPAS